MDKISNINKHGLCKIHMDLGGFYIPDKRFGTTVLSDLKLIHDRRQMEDTKSSDLSRIIWDTNMQLLHLSIID